MPYIHHFLLMLMKNTLLKVYNCSILYDYYGFHIIIIFREINFGQVRIIMLPPSLILHDLNNLALPLNLHDCQSPW